MSRIRHFARDVYARALYGWGASRLDKIPAGRLLILTLHRILPLSLRDEYPLPGLAVTPDELRWVLSCVARHFEVDTVSGAYERLRNGSSNKPLLAVSFDDGQLDNLEYGLPILDEFDIKASFYVPTDFIGTDRLLWHDAAAFAWQALTDDISASRDFVSEFQLAEALGDQRIPSVEEFLSALKRRTVEQRLEILEALKEKCATEAPPWARLMTWEEVTRLHKEGHEIGAHGRTHELLPQLDASAQVREVRGSGEAIAEAIGEAPRSFCYPNGSYDENTLASVDSAGYDNAVTTRWGMNELASAAQFELARCDVSAASLLDRRGFLSLPRLSLRLSGYQPGLSRYDGRIPESA